MPGPATMSGRSRRSATASSAAVSAGHDRGQGDRVDVAERHPVEPQQAVEQQLELVGRRPRVRRRATRREQRARAEQAERDVRVADVEGEEHGEDDTRRRSGRAVRAVRYHRAASAPPLRPPRRRRVSSPPPAKFFVNQGVVTSRTDMLHLLRPLLKQTVTYRYLRGREVVAHGTGWVERIVVDSRRHLDLLHAAGDHAQHRFVRASRVRDAARPAPRLHARPGRRAGHRRVRADRPEVAERLAVRAAPARVRHERVTSRWSC